MRRIVAKEEFCVNCHLCEVHCQVAHSKSGQLLATFKKEHAPPARITVHDLGPVSFGIQCRHCEEPFCVYSCIAGALRRDPETGHIVHEAARCVGCWTCVLVCTKGAIHPDPERHVAAKCDFCLERGGDPVCVEACPNEALVVVEEE